MSSREELLFEKGGVFIHTTIASADEDALVEGKILINQKHGVEGGVFVEWKHVPPVSTQSPQRSDNEWTVVDKEYSVKYESHKSSEANKSKKKTPPDMSCHRYIINFNIKDLKSFKRSKPNLGWSYLIFILKDGTTYPALHFHKGGTKLFMEQLKTYISFKKSPHDSCLYMVREQNPHALTTSFDELQLFDKDQAKDVVSNFFRDPYTSTLSGFSKVTSLLKNVLLEPEETASTSTAFSEIFTDDFAGVQLTKESEEDPGFEIVERREKLPPRPAVKRGSPVSPQRWSYHMDHEGRVIERDELMQAIFRGGVDPSIRIEVWKFLLGFYDFDSTYRVRTEERKKKVDSYFEMKLQWKTISAEQDRRFSLMRDRKNLIDKDVSRTDRTHDFFMGDNNPNLHVLYDILMTYCMYNFDLGYVQGMSDLLAPVLVVTENDVDAFWCFAGFMERIADNFTMDQAGMKKQLADLNVLLKFIDPELSNHLESHESSNMFFCFRWLLILFKREFSFSDIMRLWEVLWTDLPCANFHLVISIAILDTCKVTLIDNNFGFTEILKHINDLSYAIDLAETLVKAEGIYLQLKQLRELPDSVKLILGMGLPAVAASRAHSDTTGGAGADSASSTPSRGGTPRNASTPSTPERSSPRRQATPVSTTAIPVSSMAAPVGTTAIPVSTTASCMPPLEDDPSIVMLPEEQPDMHLT